MAEAFLSVPDAQFDPSAFITHIERSDAPRPSFPLLAEMFVERGEMKDWELLKHLHYKSENMPTGPRYWKLTLKGETIGCLVTANPRGLLKERHLAFPALKPGGNETKFTNQRRYQIINASFRVIARFVVDTKYRGIGASARFMNLASRLEGPKFMEIQSSMSKFNHFGQKAGFSFVKPQNPNKFIDGLKFFRMHFEASPQDQEAIIAEIEGQPEHIRLGLMEACRQFYYRHSSLEKTGANRERGKERVAAMDTKTLIKNIQQLTLASPMYGVYKNPDFGRELPEKVPLLACDNQTSTEPLKL